MSPESKSGKPADSISASTLVRIPFHDLDPAGFVWHGRYFKYFELARSLVLDSLDYNYLAMRDSGCLWPMVDTHVRYLKPLTLHQEVRVTARLIEWEYRLVFTYRVENEQGELCARARTIQVPIDAVSYAMRIGAPDVLLRKIELKMSGKASPA